MSSQLSQIHQNLGIDKDPVPLGVVAPLDYGKRDTRRILGNIRRMAQWELARCLKTDLTAKLPWGKLKINPSLDVGCTATYVYRRYSAPEINALTYGIRRGDVAWDVGAHCGVTARLMESRGAHVHAFEPDPKARKYLIRNSLGHDIFIYHCGLSSFDGEARLETPLGPAHNHVSDRGVPIRLHRGDYFMSVPDVVKIDVEGHEVDVLFGMQEKLKNVRLIVVECHNFPLAETVYGILSEFDFQLRHYCPEQTEERTWIIGKSRKIT